MNPKKKELLRILVAQGVKFLNGAGYLFGVSGILMITVGIFELGTNIIFKEFINKYNSVDLIDGRQIIIFIFGGIGFVVLGAGVNKIKEVIKSKQTLYEKNKKKPFKLFRKEHIR